VILAVNMQTSFMHPPFGFALFYLRSVAPPSVRSGDIYWGAVPFVVIQIIMVGILARLPQNFIQEVVGRMSPGGGGPVTLLLEVFIWLLIIAGCILLVQGTRRIPVQFAKRVVGNKQYGGVRNYIPLKVNAAGVMTPASLTVPLAAYLKEPSE